MVAGVTAKIQIYTIPCEFNLSYGLLLSRQWMWQVKIRGNYELDKYYIKDDKGNYHEVPRNSTAQVNAVEFPRIRLNSKSGIESTVDKETRRELELAVESSEPGEDEILREVFGQATDVMRKQMRSDGSDSSDDQELDSGNESDF